MTSMVTIEHCFAIYCATHLPKGVDPIMEADHRRAFFVGFHSCLSAIDLLAEVAHENNIEGEKAWQRLVAEFDKYSQSELEGDNTTNH